MTVLEKIGPTPARLPGAALHDWDYLVQEDRAHRLIYTDPAILEAEMTHIFGGTWTYLAHESEIPHDNDFITRRLGLRPLIVVRDGQEALDFVRAKLTYNYQAFVEAIIRLGLFLQVVRIPDCAERKP